MGENDKVIDRLLWGIIERVAQIDCNDISCVDCKRKLKVLKCPKGLD